MDENLSKRAAEEEDFKKIPIYCLVVVYGTEQFVALA